MMKQKELSPEQVKAQKVYRKWGLSEYEYNLICHKLLHRLPTFTETGLYSGMWSEHCSYKNSKAILKKLYTKGKRVIQGPGEGAGIIDIGDGQAVCFKAESHNHPSYVEPYEGAATGIGGILRDIFSMGAKPVADLDSLRFGNLDKPKNKFLLDKVVAGIAGYGNCVGVPTVGGEMSFDHCFNDNNLVNVMSVGLMNQKDREWGVAKGDGNAIIYVGAKTGRDGINGATFASHQFSESKEPNRSAVQVGDPFTEKLLIDACLETITKHHDIVVGIQDMGACGIVSSSGEMAAEGNSGEHLNLDLVPQREPNMTPYEMMLSESQERMILCVKKGHEQTVLDIFHRYGLNAVVIGRVSDDGMYRLTHHGKVVCNIPSKTLVDDVPEYKHPLVEPDRLKHPAKNVVPDVQDANAILKQMIQAQTICSKAAVYRQYDSRVQTNTVLAPGNDSGVIRVRGTKKAISMTTDCNDRYCYLDPVIGAEIAVAEGVRNIIATGGIALGCTDCFNFGKPNDSEAYYEMSKSADGLAKACKYFQDPVVSGNVSLYNETDNKPVYPTPMIGTVGLIKDNQNITTMDFKHAGDNVYVLGKTYDDFAGSELQKMLNHKKISGTIEHFDLKEEATHDQLVHQGIIKGLINSAHDLSEGGLIIGLTKCLFKQGLGFKGQVNLSAAQLFSETQARFVVSVSDANQTAFEQLMGKHAHLIGKTTNDHQLSLKFNGGQIQQDVNELKTLWKNGLACLMK